MIANLVILYCTLVSSNMAPPVSYSIEEDFVTWKEGLWPAVCHAFDIDSSSQESLMREYALTEHTDLPPEKIFSGEPHRLGSYQNQKS